jgi:hypothetical protein
MVERVHITGMEPGLAELGSAATQLEMSALLQLPLSGPCAGARRDTPPSERGVARPWMGCPLLAEGKRQGPRRGEYCGVPSRQVQPHTGNKRVEPFADGPCGSLHRRPPAVLPPPPFPFAPKPQSRNPLPPGGTPLSEGGECLRTLHSITFRSARPHPLRNPCRKFPPSWGKNGIASPAGIFPTSCGKNGRKRGWTPNRHCDVEHLLFRRETAHRVTNFPLVLQPLSPEAVR